tara:strand:+ start:134 stop:580 length:447 start_codon:yes stop_codon:yes gene_type:complete
MERLKNYFMDHPGKINLGLLAIRVVIGFSMAAFHGWGKITSPENWERLGGNMKLMGIGFAPQFWGFMAGFAEFVCSILLILGLFFRPATTLLAFTMVMAVWFHMSLPAENPSSGLKGASHALELCAIYIGLWFTGPGKFSLMPGIKKV